MRIAEFHLYEYALPLKQPLVIGERTLDLRHGYVIELKDELGGVGFGEVAPLDGYSDESLADVRGELLRLRRALVGYEIPAHLEELSGGFDRWLGDHKLSASVQFGFECAVLLLAAKRRTVSLARLLSDDPLGNLLVNALLTGDDDTVASQVRSRLEAGYSTFKLKVGRGSIDSDIQLTRKVRELIGSGAILRLDANQQWTVSEYEQFADGVQGISIDYIEEPLVDILSLRRMINSGDARIGLALDESLRSIDPEGLQEWPGVKAAILKPTMLGLERSVRFARAASRMSMTPVFSSSFESSLGLIAIAQIAAAFNLADTPTGLDTVGIFHEDLLSPSMTIRNGQVAIGELPDVCDSIDRSKLEEIADA